MLSGLLIEPYIKITFSVSEIIFWIQNNKQLKERPHKVFFITGHFQLWISAAIKIQSKISNHYLVKFNIGGIQEFEVIS